MNFDKINELMEGQPKEVALLMFAAYRLGYGLGMEALAESVRFEKECNIKAENADQYMKEV